VKKARKAQLKARDKQYNEILKRREEHEAELNAKAGPPDMGAGGAAKGKGQYWYRRLRQAKLPVRKFEANAETCGTCYAMRGEPCISKKTGYKLPLTHTTYAKRRREEARLNNPDFKPIALDKTYD
jgi:hypothetical protein